MEYDITMLVNYGALGICLGYFIYKDNVTMKDFRKAIEELKETVLILRESIK